ncbi:alpha/beta hydrolase [soil metagenome]
MPESLSTLQPNLAPPLSAELSAELTPRMRDLVERMHRAGRPPFYSMSPTEARASYTEIAEVLDLRRRPLARTQDIEIPAADGVPLPARVYAPGAGALPVMLYLHGGGFTVGNLETHDSLCRQMASRSGAAVVALDYRLAPDHRFPVAVDDAFTALEWLAGKGAASLGFDQSRLAVGGDSAGGTLAAACAIHARDTGLKLALQLLITPGTTARQDTASHALYRHGPVLDAATIDWFFNLYIDDKDRDDWRFAPLNADDLEGVAPACVVLAEVDPLSDEGLAYADRLRAAGVAVQLELYRGVTHDFIKMGRFLPEAIAAQAAAGAALADAFGLPETTEASR